MSKNYLFKKSYFILLACVLVFGLSACKNKKEVSIEFKDASVEMTVGELHALDLEVLEANKYNAEEILNNIEYSVSDDSIVKIVDGKISAISPGKATIVACWKEYTECKATIEITVVAPILPTVVVTQKEYSLALNKKVQMKYTLTPSNEAKYLLSWVSKNLDIATVNDSGEVTSLKAGTATIALTVKSAYDEATYEFIVKCYQALYNITYVLDGGEFATQPDNNYNVDELPFVLAIPTKVGYTFKGWKIGNDLITSIEKGTTGDITVIATWSKDPVYYNITYELDGGVNSASAPIKYLEGGSTALYSPEKEGFKFLGWYLNSDFSGSKITKISSSQTGNITLYALWEEIIITDFTITYNYEDGELPTHIASNITEFANVLWSEFYQWSKSKDSLETFKASQIASWKSGNAGKYKFYVISGKDTIDESYFINCKANYDKWIGFMNAFDSQVTSINASQSAWGSGFVGYMRLKTLLDQSASYWTAERTKICYEAYNIETPLVTEYHLGDTIALTPLVINDGRTFLGWYDASNNLVESITPTTKGNLVLTAKWSASTPVTGFSVTNKIEKLLKLHDHQLTWEFTPSDCTNKKLKFASSDTSVATIDENGLIHGVDNGTTKITVTVLGNTELNVSFDVVIYIEEFIDGSFESDTYVEPENTINLNAKIIGSLDETSKILWRSKNNEIATVDSNGVVTGVKAGYCEIEAYLSTNEKVNLTFGVTIIPLEDSSFFSLIAKSHNPDIYVTDDLFVGYAYHTPVYCSASDLLFNYSYSENTSHVIPLKSDNRPGTIIKNMEFITVHYTAGTNSSSTAENTAIYFNSAAASANYCTGNDGIFNCVPAGEVAYHAGDGTGTTFTWTNTGVKAETNTKPTWGVIKNAASSSGYYFTLNGVATTIVVPTTGKSSSGVTKTMEDPSKCFTFFGPAWKVVDEYYYMGTTWACFTQTLEGRISSRGGNNNSVGIETACNKGSDLWYTYQITAQLIARLLEKYNLDTTRVVGHNAFSGKDCPQTLLANEGELWYKFMECVEAENEMNKTMKDYTITCKSNNPNILMDNGRIIKIPNYTTTVSYTVTVKNNTTGVVKTQTFSSIVHGVYTK